MKIPYILIGLLGFTAAIHAQTQLLSDNFTRGTDPGPLAPWTNQFGTWTVTQGVMRGGTNALSSYGVATLRTNFSNYSLQGRVRFPVGAFGGGLGGRVNTNTGTRYVAWIYPENSAGGSNVLKLLKFSNYTTFGYNGTAAMATTNLPAVGTNFHTLKLDFVGPQVRVAFDTNVAVVTVTDIEATPLTNANSAACLEFWTDATGYLFTADDVVISSLPLTTSNDTYTAVSGLTRNVPAPGVLGNDSGGLGTLTAQLVAGPTRGTFTFTNNGGFTYRATNSYTGPDSFTYRATDGSATSAVTTASITVTANTPPVANGDSFSVQINNTLTVAAPGVLANDTDAEGNSLTAALVNGVANGSLSFSNNGSFVYTPTAAFSGLDSFTYRANDGLSNSANATVTISVLPPGLFADSFTRGADPGPLSPWTNQVGAWTVTAGELRGGLNPAFSYGFATLASNWDNYAVSARVKFPAGSFGGGIGGRLTPETGAHYAAWIYPEGSSGGSSVMSLIKFQNYMSFGYLGVPGARMATISLPSVGTNYHKVELGMHADRIAVYLDDVQMISMTDTEATPYTNGGVSLDFWTDAAPYVMAADDALVTKLAGDNLYSVNEDTTLTIAAPGVLTDDTAVYTTNLTATLITDVTNGTLTLNSNGSFTYRGATNYNGQDSFTYRANDGTADLGIATVNIAVNQVNDTPILPNQTNFTVAELTTVIVTNLATDQDLPTQTISYQLLTPPAGAVNTNGIIYWTPSEAQGPGTYTLRSVATDNGTPPRSATNSFTVAVTESNVPPTLPPQADRTINELTLMTVVNTMIDPDLPANTATYTLLEGPAGAVISASGIITWTPTEAQGPMVTNITTRVVDNGSPPFSATNTFTVTVLDVNSAPVFPVQTNHTIAPLTPLVVNNFAVDTDIPANNVTLTLLTAPPAATLSPAGEINWTPALADDRTTNLFQTVATDDGTPPLSSTNSFLVFVNTDPVITISATILAQEDCLATNNAIDPGETVTVLFSLQNSGTGNTTNLVVTLLPTNGVVPISAPQAYGTVNVGGPAVTQPFTFSSTGLCGSSITATLQLQDGTKDWGLVTTTLPLGGSGILLTQNFDTVTVPALPVGWLTNYSANMPAWRTTNTVVDTPTNAAYVADPTNTGTSALLSPVLNLPAGQSQLSFRHRYSLESSNATVGYDGGVVEIKIGAGSFTDVITAGGSFVSGNYNSTIIYAAFHSPIIGRQCWSGTNNAYTNVIINLPPSAVGQPIQLRWLMASDDGGPGGGWRVDSIGINGALCCINQAPVLPPPTDRTLAELTTLTVTNTATDPTGPPGALSYALVNPPAGAGINSVGVISWTPDETQGPGVYSLTTVVSDSATPPLRGTNTFSVTVTEANLAPALPPQPNRTIAELTPLTVANVATDPDLPANGLTYSLVNAPAGAAISPVGVITWTPDETQGPGLFTLITVATDDGFPALSATNSFSVTVTEQNTAPTLPLQTDRTVAEETQLVVINTGSDTDQPANALHYSLVSPPAGAGISPAGVITWTPDESQGPGLFTFVTVVTDDGVPPLNTTNSFTVTVTEQNTAPTLPLQVDRTLAEQTQLVVTNTGNDVDLPTNALVYTLLSAPAGASISGAGVISWTPAPEQSGTTNLFTTILTDDGVPPLSATNNFLVVVALSAGTLQIQAITLSNGVVTVTWSSEAGRNYRLQYVTNITDVPWLDLEPDIKATSETTSTINNVGDDPQRFYRVKLLP